MSSSAESADAKGSAEDTSTRKIKVYTRTGDKGSSSLFNGSRVSKTADYFDALGDTDELNAHIGLAREYSLASSVQLPLLTDTLAEIQSRLFDVGAHLATPKTTSKAAQLERTVFPEESVKELESSIDRMEEDLPPLKNFILPGGGLTATHLQVARAVARRAERHVVPLVERGDADPVVGRFLNRLSDYLFVAARYASFHEKKPEVVWRKPRTAGKDSQES